MYPAKLELVGLSLSVWNATFLLSILAGCSVLRIATEGGRQLDFFPLRCVVSLYLIVLGAQFFAYAFDAHTSLYPPPDTSYAAYFFNPLAGPKTLYGAVVLTPAAVALARAGSTMSLARALDVWAPALFTVLTGARIGCFLQGCCYGISTERFGIAFAVGSPVYYEQLHAGLIHEGTPALPVVPTQIVEAAFLGVVAAVSLKSVCAPSQKRRDGRVFVGSVAAYSIFRFLIEFVRGDADRGIYGFLSTSQWIAAAVLVIAGLQSWRSRA